MEHGIRGVNPHSGSRMWFIFGKRKGSCKSSTVFGSNEQHDGLAEVAIEPGRHVIRLLEPRFGFASLNQVSQHNLYKKSNTYRLVQVLALLGECPPHSESLHHLRHPPQPQMCPSA